MNNTCKEVTQAASQSVLSSLRASFDQAAAHPLLSGMASGTIATDTFVRYLSIEHRFVQHAARTLGYCIWQSPDLSAMKFHAHALSGLLEDQEEYFVVNDVLPNGAVHPSASALELVLSDAEKVGYGAVLCCLFTAENLYAMWCQHAVERPVARSENLQQWILMHTSTSFLTGVQQLGTLLDEVGAHGLSSKNIEFWCSRMLAAENEFHSSALSERKIR